VRLALRLAIFLGVLALLLPAETSAYPWPIRPFYEQHAIRGYFNDPRQSGPEQGFHFGVDISAPDGTPVYAVTSGYARVRGTAVSVIPWRRGVPRLSYWHVVPVVRTKQFVRKFELIGHVVAGAGHVHLAEWKNGTYINPLRIGGLAPYIDDTVPRIPSLTFSSSGQPIRPEAVSGNVDIVAESFDTSPMPIPPPWEQSIFAPALIRWRIVQGEPTIWHWTNAVDFRMYLVPFSLFDFVYGPGTSQNRPGRRGRYEFYLAHQFDTRLLPNGSYVVEIDALDEQENVGHAAFSFTVAN
jgi:hypothetical protein